MSTGVFLKGNVLMRYVLQSYVAMIVGGWLNRSLFLEHIEVRF